MVQNRNKLIILFIGNATNVVVHRLLAKAVDDKELANRYNKEEIVSLEVAKKYRKKINPIGITLPEKDINYIKNKLIQKVKSELESRISKGYKNIEMNNVEEMIEQIIIEMKVI